MDRYLLKYFRESETFTFIQLKSELEDLAGEKINEVELLKVVTILKNKRVIVQYRSVEERESYINDFDYNSSEYEDLDFSEIDPTKKQVFVVRYVGIVMVNKYVFKCYPKYIETKASLSHYDDTRIDMLLQQIMLVLRVYNSRREKLYSATDEIAQEDFDFLSMAIFFLNDFLENGLYYNEKKSLEVNGVGEINWVNTINETDAIITQNGPVYTELITEFTEADDFDLFKRIHMFIISHCSKVLSDARLIEVLSLNGAFDFDVDKESIGDDDFILEKIEKEMTVQFITKKLELLTKMYTFFARNSSTEKENEVSLYGTSHFHTVWEEVCQEVFNNILFEELKHLPGQNKLDYYKLVQRRYKEDDSEKVKKLIKGLKHTSLIEFIEKPIWNITTSGQPVLGKKTYIPDVLQIYDEKGVLHFNILDAKYRNFIINNSGSIKSAPGVEEITKQYMYQLVFSDLLASYDYEKDNIKVINTFIFPGDRESVYIMGSAEIKALSRLGLENITAVRLPAAILYKLYIENRKIYNYENLIYI